MILVEVAVEVEAVEDGEQQAQAQEQKGQGEKQMVLEIDQDDEGAISPCRWCVIFSSAWCAAEVMVFSYTMARSRLETWMGEASLGAGAFAGPLPRYEAQTIWRV